VWGAGYYCRYDGDIVPQASEVAAVHMMTEDDIAAGVSAGRKFTPDSLRFLQLFQEYVREHGRPG
jgi:hypothetical protein